MTARGAEFGELQPTNAQGQLDLSFRELESTMFGDLDAARIQQVTPNNSFRLGQQVYFWLGIQNPVATIEGVPGSENWATRLRLKLWWARPAREYRQPGGGSGDQGASGFLPIDRQVYGPGPLVDPLEDNRYVWTPSPKRLDITQFDTPPPPVPPARNSDSLLLDDCWTLDLYDPTSPALQAKFPPPQAVTRWAPILYPAFGFALGFTGQVEYSRTPGAQVAVPDVLYSLTWSVGTFGGGARISESIG